MDQQSSRNFGQKPALRKPTKHIVASRKMSPQALLEIRRKDFEALARTWLEKSVDD